MLKESVFLSRKNVCNYFNPPVVRIERQTEILQLTVTIEEWMLGLLDQCFEMVWIYLCVIQNGDWIRTALQTKEPHITANNSPPPVWMPVESGHQIAWFWVFTQAMEMQTGISTAGAKLWPYSFYLRACSLRNFDLHPFIKQWLLHVAPWKIIIKKVEYLPEK